MKGIVDSIFSITGSLYEYKKKDFFIFFFLSAEIYWLILVNLWDQIMYMKIWFWWKFISRKMISDLMTGWENVCEMYYGKCKVPLNIEHDFVLPIKWNSFLVSKEKKEETVSRNKIYTWKVIVLKRLEKPVQTY